MRLVRTVRGAWLSRVAAQAWRLSARQHRAYQRAVGPGMPPGRLWAAAAACLCARAGGVGWGGPAGGARGISSFSWQTGCWRALAGALDADRSPGAQRREPGHGGSKKAKKKPNQTPLQDALTWSPLQLTRPDRRRHGMRARAHRRGQRRGRRRSAGCRHVRPQAGGQRHHVACHTGGTRGACRPGTGLCGCCRGFGRSLGAAQLVPVFGGQQADGHLITLHRPVLQLQALSSGRWG